MILLKIHPVIFVTVFYWAEPFFSDFPQLLKLEQPLHPMYNGSEVSYVRVLKIVAGENYGKASNGPFGSSAAKFVTVYDQYFAPDKSTMFGSNSNKAGTAKYRIGYYITNSGVDGDLSKVSTKLTGSKLSLGSGVVGGTVSTTADGQTTTVNGLKVNSYSDNLNPIVVQGTNSSKTTIAKINNANISLLGKSDGNGTVCDFSACRMMKDLQPYYQDAEFFLCRRRKLLRSTSCPVPRIPSCRYLQPDAGTL